LAVARPDALADVNTAVNMADSSAPLPSAVTAAAGNFTVKVNARPAVTDPLTGPSL
jgi:hypothetical protein